ncbi:Sugar phosphatase YidA [compost metagenome]
MNQRWPLNNVVVRANRELNEVNYRDQTRLISVKDVGGDFHSFLQNTHEVIYKAAVICQDQLVCEQLFQELQNQECFELSRTGNLRFDVNAQGITKRKALETLCELHTIGKEEVAAAGDYDNDLDMLQWAGLGIAMGNAAQHVQKLAKVVTTSNQDDGVAEAIHSYLLAKTK